MDKNGLSYALFARTTGAKDKRKRKRKGIAGKLAKGAVAGALTGVTAASTPVLLAKVARENLGKKFKKSISKRIPRISGALKKASTGRAMEAAGAAGTIVGAGIGAEAARRKAKRERDRKNRGVRGKIRKYLGVA